MVELEFLVGVGDWGREIYTRYEFPFFLFLSFFFFPLFRHTVVWESETHHVMSVLLYSTCSFCLFLFFLSFIRVNTMVDLYEKKKTKVIIIPSFHIVQSSLLAWRRREWYPLLAELDVYPIHAQLQRIQ